MGNTHGEQKALGNKFVGLYIDKDLHGRLKADCALKNESIKERLMRLIEKDLNEN